MLKSYVQEFADDMCKLLDENKHKGERGWEYDSELTLLVKLMEEVGELAQLIYIKSRKQNLQNDEIILENIKKEAVDVGNMAMMLYDKQKVKK
jgi:NTP pyrophosphatase (non-canonical NTP hydrolase)